jgi:ribosomal protein S20
MTLKEAASNGELNENTKVLLKIFATQDKQFVDRITLTTNSQNAVSSRDLSSNDQVQRYLEDLFQAKGYYYERKPGQFRELQRSERSRIIPNDKAGQSHLAVVEHLPAIAMANSNKIWSESYYQQIYGSRVEELLGSYLIYTFCLNRSKELGSSLEGLDKTILKYSNFHLARVIGGLQLGEDWRHSSTKDLEDFVRKLEQNPAILEDDYGRARTIIKQVVEEISDGDTTKIINVLKSDKIQQRLDSLMSKAP